MQTKSRKGIQIRIIAIDSGFFFQRQWITCITCNSYFQYATLMSMINIPLLYSNTFPYQCLLSTKYIAYCLPKNRRAYLLLALGYSCAGCRCTKIETVLPVYVLHVPIFIGYLNSTKIKMSCMPSFCPWLKNTLFNDSTYMDMRMTRSLLKILHIIYLAIHCTVIHIFFYKKLKIF